MQETEGGTTCMVGWGGAGGGAGGGARGRVMFLAGKRFIFS